MASVLVTGSNRGLGLEWVRQFAGVGWRVYATCRDPRTAQDLAALALRHPGVTVHRLDVTRPDEVDALARALAGEALDVLVNNAGVYRERWGRAGLGRTDYEAWEETFRVNTLGPVRVTEALVECVARSERRLVVAITSHMGSIADITSPRDYAYRSSKAALNAAMRGLSFELAERRVGVLVLHPGWVRTRMGGDRAPFSPEESVAGMRGLVERFTPAMSGRFFRFDGEELPW
jgi:NAD(P)-dependent dehydrogenase (short-subunit alcohol dehydrogenase family)